MSSTSLISCCSMITLSGQADVSRISGGMVEGGFSAALRVGRSASTLASASVFKALSRLHVYLPCNRAVGQLDRI